MDLTTTREERLEMKVNVPTSHGVLKIKTKEVKRTTMRWCSNDCHPQPMWRGRKNCLNKAGFAKRVQDSQDKEGKTENNSSYKLSSEFKIDLAAMCSEEDFEHLDKHFFSKN